MAWPTSTDYFEAVQSPSSFSDAELQKGEVSANALGLPKACTGNFADVYQITCANNQNWAVKCFTRDISGLQQRYQLLSDHLEKIRFPFTVDFRYFAQGTRVRGQWYPMLKMRWVEGFTLNSFVHEHVDKPQRLKVLMQMWIKLAKQLRAANIAHGDLQHGNVLLVPSADGKSVRLTLIDYDGMIVPALTEQPSGEVGHPSYQHPERLNKGLYSLDVDRFSHLVICCAFQCLAVAGKPLWERHDNGDNLLFRKEDFADPRASKLLQELWQLPDPTAHILVGNLILACDVPMAQVPALEVLFSDESAPLPLSERQEERVCTLLGLPAPPPSVKPKRTQIDDRPRSLDSPIAWNKKKRVLLLSLVSAGVFAFLLIGVLVLGFFVVARFLGQPGDPQPNHDLTELNKARVTELIAKGNTASDAGQFDVAVLAFEEAVRLGANDPDLPAMLHHARSARDLQANADKTKKESIALIERAQQAIDEKRYEDAVNLFEAALKLDPTSFAVANNLRGARQMLTETRAKEDEKARIAKNEKKRLDDEASAKAADDEAKRKKEYDGLLVIAAQALKDQRFDDAIASYESARNLYPKSRIVEEGLRQARRDKSSFWERDITNSIGMKLVNIPRGSFVMGSPPKEKYRLAQEGPQHEVELTQEFYFGRHPVTQKAYREIMGVNPSYFNPSEERTLGFNTDDFPVDRVSWDDAVKFCNLLSKKEGKVYRLPTEAEWEYACRAGVRQGPAFHVGETLSSKLANVNDALKRTSRVGSYSSNGFGLYDMHGNVWQWCSDWYDPKAYSRGNCKDPAGPPTGTHRVRRGGAYHLDAGFCRSASRTGFLPSSNANSIGFRVVLNAQGSRDEGKPVGPGDEGKPIALTIEKGPATYAGNLTQADPRYQGKIHKLFVVQLEAGRTYQVDNKSRNFDAYLYLIGPDGNVLGQNDDSNGSLDSQIIHRAAKTGVYRIVATSLGGQGMGQFMFSIRQIQ